MFYNKNTKENIDRELAMILGKNNSGQLKILQSHHTRASKFLKLIRYAKVTQTRQYEHEFHQDRENKKVELARLEEKVNLNRKLVDKLSTYETLLNDLAKYKGLDEANKTVITELKSQLSRADENIMERRLHDERSAT